MKTMTFRTRILVPALFALFSLGASGCAIVDSVYGEERLRSQQGTSVSEFIGPMNVVACDGNLYVTASGRRQGIGQIDTATDIVTDYRKLKDSPYDLTCGPEGAAYFRLINWSLSLERVGIFDSTKGLTVSEPFYAGGNASLTVTSGHTLIIRSQEWRIDTIIPNTQSILIKNGRQLPIRAEAVAHTEHGTFITTPGLYGSVHFFPAGLAQSIQSSHSIILADTASGSPTYQVRALIAHGDAVFALLNFGLNSSSVAVIDAATRTIVKHIPLNFASTQSAGVLHGKLYLFGSVREWHASSDLSGGVEIIDLRTQTHAGTFITEQDINAYISDFTPLTERTGYVIYSPPYTSNSYLMRVESTAP